MRDDLARVWRALSDMDGWRRMSPEAAATAAASGLLMAGTAVGLSRAGAAPAVVMVVTLAMVVVGVLLALIIDQHRRR